MMAIIIIKISLDVINIIMIDIIIDIITINIHHLQSASMMFERSWYIYGSNFILPVNMWYGIPTCVQSRVIFSVSVVLHACLIVLCTISLIIP